MDNVIWEGASRYGHHLEYRRYYFEDGVLAFDKIKRVDGKCNRETLDWIRGLGYDSPILGSCVDRMFFNPSVGKDREYLEGRIKKAAKKLDDRRRKIAEDGEKWDELRKRFNGFVIGVDKTVDVYGSGFSVRVLLSAQKSFDERKRFIKENRNDFWRYVIGELENNKRAMGKVGDMRFYEPDELIILRAPEVEVKFKVREGIQ